MKVVLRRFRADDEAAIAMNANDRDVWRNLRDRFPHPYTLADARAWIANVPETNWVIEVDGVFTGGIGWTRGEDVFRRSAEIGYWLGRAHWGKGIATEALRIATARAFEATDIVRLHSGVFAWNRASARVMEKNGYVLEGRMRSAVWKDGQLVDELLYAKVREP